MNRFTALEELQEFLRRDKDAASLSPIRFINVDNMEMWSIVKKIAMEMSAKSLYLSSYCSKEDTTPNMRRFNAYLKASEGTICVSPISEYLRVFPDMANEVLQKLISQDYPGNAEGRMRIYIPMYRMRSILLTMANSDPRKKDCITMLSTDEESDYSLTIVKNDLKVKLPGNEIHGFKQYMQYWEQNPDKPLILHTQNAIHLGQKTFFDNVRVLVTSYDLLKHCYALPACLEEQYGSEENWNQLAVTVAAEKSFEAACCHDLLSNKYNNRLFDKWQFYGPYQRWLLWIWSKEKKPDGYLGLCVALSTSPSHLTELIYTKIVTLLSDSRFDEYAQQRKQLLNSMMPTAPESFWLLLEELPAMDRLRVLTDRSNMEREKIFAELKNIPKDKREETLNILELSYPALWRYLKDRDVNTIDGMTDELSEYFTRYRWNKAANVLPEDFVGLVQKYAMQKGETVYALKARNMIVSEEYNKSTAIIFADGMGLEYVNYLLTVLKPLQKNGYHMRARVGYCNLPSTTEVNRDFLQERRVALDLRDPDEMKHGNTAYPESIQNELHFLDGLNDAVQEAFKTGVSRVILTTDHGTSRMAVLVRGTEFDQKHPPKNHSIYKYGRYCEGTDMAEELPTAIEYGDKLIFADYQRFEQKGAPFDETHGGASLEEWLVPVIIIDSPSTRQTMRIFKITPPKGNLSMNVKTRTVCVRFTLAPFCEEEVCVMIHGKKLVCGGSNPQYMFDYRPRKGESSASAKVYVGTEEVGEFTFRIKQGIEKNKKFDI